jgi:hypothetical protein
MASLHSKFQAKKRVLGLISIINFTDSLSKQGPHASLLVQMFFFTPKTLFCVSSLVWRSVRWIEMQQSTIVLLLHSTYYEV